MKTKFEDALTFFPKLKGPIYLTGSRFYGNKHQINCGTDYDFFGIRQHIEYWVDKLIEDGYEITTGEYFNRSFYAKKDECIINLICVRDSMIKAWAFNTLLVKSLYDNQLIKDNSKEFYIPIFEMFCSLLKLNPLNNLISDGLTDKLITFTDMYPEMFDLHDITNPSKSMLF